MLLPRRLATVVVFFSALCQPALCGTVSTYNVTLDTAPLVGHSAGPFYFYLELVDGSGVGDGNNIITLSNFTFGGGSALGGATIFGGATGSLETNVSITDSSFVSLFAQQFAPGLALKFSLGLTNNDDSGGVPDGLTLFLLDNSGVPLPTVAPFGDYFLASAIGSSGPVFEAYGSDSARAPSVGNPISISAPIVTGASSVPEPSSIFLLANGVASVEILRRYLRRRLVISSLAADVAKHVPDA